MMTALLLGASLALTVAAGPGASAPRTAAPLVRPQDDGDEIKRLEAWPDLGKAKSQAKTDIQRLRKARTPEMAEEAEVGLVQAGAGIVPLLLPALGKEREPEALERMEAVLTRVTGAEHTRLLAEFFDDGAGGVRTFALRRVASFPDAGVRAGAEKAFARVAKLGEKAEREELYAASLCAASSGSLESFDTLASWSPKRWATRGAEMRAAVGALRGEAATAKALEHLKSTDRERTVVALHLLSACGDASSTEHVKPFLDSDDNSIRVAAINALRGIVDGEPPLERLPVFDAIELAKKWKTRV